MRNLPSNTNGQHILTIMCREYNKEELGKSITPNTLNAVLGDPNLKTTKAFYVP